MGLDESSRHTEYLRSLFANHNGRNSFLGEEYAAIRPFHTTIPPNKSSDLFIPYSLFNLCPMYHLIMLT